MVKKQKGDALNDLVSAFALVAYILISLFLAYGGLFAGGGAESEVNLFSVLISTGAGIVGAFFIVTSKLFRALLRGSDKKFGWINSTIHDTEESIFPVEKKGFRWIKNPLILIVVFIVLSSLVGLVQVNQQTFLTVLPVVSQQITETGELLLSIFPAEQEVLAPLAIGGFILAILAWMQRQKKIDRSIELVIGFIAVPVFYAVTWLLVHNFAHSSSELAIRFVFLFGLISGLLLVLFRSIIPVLVLKIINNLYVFLSGAIQSNETILMITIGIIVALVVITIIISVLTRKKSKTESDG